MKSANASTAIALLDATTVAAPQVKKFGDAVANQFGEIARTEQSNARRAILTGLALPILKASLPKGTFTAWMKGNLTQGKIWTATTAIKNASLYTRLGLAFVAKAKPAAPELLALTNGKTITGKLATKDGHGAQLLKRLEEFVGEKSLAELLAEHVKNATPGGGGDDATTVTLPADDSTLLQDIAESLMTLRKTVTDPETLKRLTAAQINQLKKQLDDTQEDFRKALAALHR